MLLLGETPSINEQLKREMLLATDNLKSTCLHFACKNGHLRVAELVLFHLKHLLVHTESTNTNLSLHDFLIASDMDGLQAVHHACRGGHTEIVMALLDSCVGDQEKSILLRARAEVMDSNNLSDAK